MKNEIEKLQCKDACMCLCRVRYVLTLKVRPYTYERVLCSVRTRSSRRQAAQRKIIFFWIYRNTSKSACVSVLVFYFSRKIKEKKGCQETESEGGNCKNRKYKHTEESRKTMAWPRGFARMHQKTDKKTRAIGKSGRGTQTE